VSGTGSLAHVLVGYRSRTANSGIAQVRNATLSTKRTRTGPGGAPTRGRGSKDHWRLRRGAHGCQGRRDGKAGRRLLQTWHDGTEQALVRPRVVVHGLQRAGQVPGALRGRSGLCFSGGADSVAALAVLPERTRSYHLLRLAPQDERPTTLMNTRVAVESFEVVRRLGRSVTLVPSVVEYLRHPVGFPHDLLGGSAGVDLSVAARPLSRLRAVVVPRVWGAGLRRARAGGVRADRWRLRGSEQRDRPAAPAECGGPVLCAWRPPGTPLRPVWEVRTQDAAGLRGQRQMARRPCAREAVARRGGASAPARRADEGRTGARPLRAPLPRRWRQQRPPEDRRGQSRSRPPGLAHPLLRAMDTSPGSAARPLPSGGRPTVAQLHLAHDRRRGAAAARLRRHGHGRVSSRRSGRPPALDGPHIPPQDMRRRTWRRKGCPGRRW
jgi:hypothetical protein